MEKMDKALALAAASCAKAVREAIASNSPERVEQLAYAAAVLALAAKGGSIPPGMRG